MIIAVYILAAVMASAAIISVSSIVGYILAALTHSRK